MNPPPPPRKKRRRSSVEPDPNNQSQLAPNRHTNAGPRNSKPRKPRTTPRQVTRRKPATAGRTTINEEAEQPRAPPHSIDSASLGPPLLPPPSSAQLSSRRRTGPRTSLTPSPTDPPSSTPYNRRETPNVDAWLPTDRALFTARPPVLKHIPHRSRPELSCSLALTIWDFESAKTEATRTNALRRIFMWPTAMLLALPPKAHPSRIRPDGSRATNKALMMERLNKWKTGETRALWHDVDRRATNRNNRRRARRDSGHDTTQPEIVRRVIKLAQEGALGKAMRAFDSNGIHAATPDVQTALLQKHPQTTDPQEGTTDFDATVPAPSIPTIHAVTAHELLRCIRKFPAASAGGGTKLSPTHLYELTSCPDAKEENGLVSAMAHLCTTLLRGEAPTRLAPWLAGAPLTALRKPDNGIRPIAVGETLRRLVSSIALRRVSDEAAGLLQPHQFGVAMKNGAETIIHATRRWTQIKGGDNGYGLQKVDLKNAFNLVSRRVLIREVARRLPQLAPWTRYCYDSGQDPYVWADKFEFRSHAGVQQGDPLGPLFFSLVLRPVLTILNKRLERAARKADGQKDTNLRSSGGPTTPPLNHHHHRNHAPYMLSFYLDDGVIIGRHEVLREAISFLSVPAIKKHGLHLGENKTHVWWPSPPTEATAAQYPPWTSLDRAEGTIILGSPVGSSEYQRTEMHRLTMDRKHKLTALRTTEDAHITLTLLRACFGVTQMNYHLRTVPPRDTAAASRAYDTAAGELLRSLAGGTLPIDVLDELMLPVRVESEEKAHFGIGLTSARHTHNAAYLSIRLATAEQVHALTHRAAPNDDDDDAPPPEHPMPTSSPPVLHPPDRQPAPSALPIDTSAEEALQRFKDQICTDDVAQFDGVKDWTQWPKPNTQRDLCRLINDKRISAIPRELSTTRDSHYRAAQALPGAKDWLKCRPNQATDTYISDRDYRTWFAFYCRRPIHNQNRICIRKNCTAVMDQHGDHLLHCDKSARGVFSPLIRRHDAMVRLLERDLSNANRSPRVEPREVAENHHVRPDILALGCKGGEDIIDVAVSHHFKPTTTSTQLPPLSRLRQRHGEKIKRYTDYHKAMTGSEIVPIIMAATGGYEHQSYEYLCNVAEAIAHRAMMPLRLIKAQLFTRYAARLLGSNARCLLSGAVD